MSPEYERVPDKVPEVTVEGPAILARTPAALAALLDGLPDRWVDVTEGPGSWSPRMVVGHLVHGERTDWIPRAQLILARGPDPRFRPVDRQAQFRDYAETPMAELLSMFSRLRRENIQQLASWALTEEHLSLTGIHPDFGVVTLGQLLATWVAHDLSHLAQVARVMARQYTDAVGPWRAYLPILTR